LDREHADRLATRNERRGERPAREDTATARSASTDADEFGGAGFQHASDERPRRHPVPARDHEAGPLAPHERPPRPPAPLPPMRTNSEAPVSSTRATSDPGATRSPPAITRPVSSRATRTRASTPRRPASAERNRVNATSSVTSSARVR